MQETLRRWSLETSLVVQWLRRHTSNEVGTDSIHGWG